MLSIYSFVKLFHMFFSFQILIAFSPCTFRYDGGECFSYSLVWRRSRMFLRVTSTELIAEPSRITAK